MLINIAPGMAVIAFCLMLQAFQLYDGDPLLRAE